MTKRKTPITNGSPSHAKAAAKTAKKITDGILVSPLLFDGLVRCYSELMSIHCQFGDANNAREHSAALKLVGENVTSDLLTDFKRLQLPTADLQKLITEGGRFRFDIKHAVSLFQSEQNKPENLNVFSILTHEEIKNRIIKIYIDNLGVEPSEMNLTLEDKIDPTKYGADSLDTVELVMALEEEFNIDITDDFAEYVVNLTFGQLAETLKRAATA